MLILHHRYRIELGFLLVASLDCLGHPVDRRIHLVLGMALLGFFAFYLIKVSRQDDAGNDEPELVGPAARIGSLATSQRRPWSSPCSRISVGDPGLRRAVRGSARRRWHRR